MPEEIKSKILKFLQERKGRKFVVKKLWEESRFASLPTIHKWISVLIAEKKINVEDYGNIKLVWID